MSYPTSLPAVSTYLSAQDLPVVDTASWPAPATSGALVAEEKLSAPSWSMMSTGEGPLCASLLVEGGAWACDGTWVQMKQRFVNP